MALTLSQTLNYHRRLLVAALRLNHDDLVARSDALHETCYLTCGSNRSLRLAGLQGAESLDLGDHLIGGAHAAVMPVHGLDRAAVAGFGLRRAGVLNLGDQEAAVGGVAHRGLDALVGHHAIDHQELDPEEHIVVVCHHGVRSANVANWLRQQGFDNAQSMRGGIDLWSRTVDPKVPLY